MVHTTTLAFQQRLGTAGALRQPSSKQQRRQAARQAALVPRADGAAPPPAAPEQPAQQPEQRAAVAPCAPSTALLPSSTFGRMSQMLRGMDEEMAALERAFGLPSSLMPRMSRMSRMVEGFPDLALPAHPHSDSLSHFNPLAVDICDTGAALEISADVPGFAKDDLKVEVSPNRVLTISGTRSSEQKEGSEEEGTMRVERTSGTFLRRICLPKSANVEEIKATAKDGVLHLTIPKLQPVEPQPLSIPVEDASPAPEPQAAQPEGAAMEGAAEQE